MCTGQPQQSACSWPAIICYILSYFFCYKRKKFLVFKEKKLWNFFYLSLYDKIVFKNAKYIKFKLNARCPKSRSKYTSIIIQVSKHDILTQLDKGSKSTAEKIKIIESKAKISSLLNFFLTTFSCLETL